MVSFNFTPKNENDMLRQLIVAQETRIEELLEVNSVLMKGDRVMDDFHRLFPKDRRSRRPYLILARHFRRWYRWAVEKDCMRYPWPYGEQVLHSNKGDGPHES